MEPILARRNKLPITPTWCEWPEECVKKATVQVVVFQADTLKVDSVWYACDYHGGEGKGPHTCRLDDVEGEGYDFVFGEAEGTFNKASSPVSLAVVQP